MRNLHYLCRPVLVSVWMSTCVSPFFSLLSVCVFISLHVCLCPPTCFLFVFGFYVSLSFPVSLSLSTCLCLCLSVCMSLSPPPPPTFLPPSNNSITHLCIDSLAKLIYMAFESLSDKELKLLQSICLIKKTLVTFKPQHNKIKQQMAKKKIFHTHTHTCIHSYLSICAENAPH